MTYKEFNDWCNQRACDGFWGLDTAIFCTDIVRTIQKLPFWKRTKAWASVKDEVELVVLEVEKIKVLKGGEGMAEIDYKEYARQMRENCVKDYNGNIICSAELWEQIASIIESIDTIPKLIETLKGGA